MHQSFVLFVTINKSYIYIKKLLRELNSMTRKLCNLLTCLISKISPFIIKNT